MTLLTIWTYRQNQTDQTVPDLIGKQQWRWQIGQQHARGRRLQLGCPTWSLWRLERIRETNGDGIQLGYRTSLHHITSLFEHQLDSDSVSIAIQLWLFFNVCRMWRQQRCPVSPWRAPSATTGPWQRDTMGRRCRCRVCWNRHPTLVMGKNTFVERTALVRMAKNQAVN